MIASTINRGTASIVSVEGLDPFTYVGNFEKDKRSTQQERRKAWATGDFSKVGMKREEDGGKPISQSDLSRTLREKVTGPLEQLAGKRVVDALNTDSLAEAIKIDNTDLTIEVQGMPDMIKDQTLHNTGSPYKAQMTEREALIRNILGEFGGSFQEKYDPNGKYIGTVEEAEAIMSTVFTRMIRRIQSAVEVIFDKNQYQWVTHPERAGWTTKEGSNAWRIAEAIVDNYLAKGRINANLS